MSGDPRPRIVVAGLGPGGREHVTAETLRAIDRIPHLFLRTARHPTADLARGAPSFDDVYEAAQRFEDVYAEIVERLVAAARQLGEVLYLVPGSPLVLERSVAALRGDARVVCDVLPAMSFLDVAWARLGIDPIEAGVRLVDGHEFATAAANADGALLVAHAHANWVLSEIKLSVDDPSGGLDATPVVLLQALGTPDERVVHTTWAEMDRVLEADHLTTLYIPALASSVAAGYVRFHRLARTLRERCPWDIEQTHRSLVPYLIEETYEVVDAIHALVEPGSETDSETSGEADADPDAALIEELGDLLYQIEFHATIAEQQGRFTIADVTAAVHDKLVRRHPHVFGDTVVDGTGQVLANWDAIKRAEKRRTSVFDGVPSALPALSYAQQLQHKASKVGFDWADASGALAKIGEEAAEVVAAAGDRQSNAADRATAVADEIGDLLFAVVNVARHLGVDGEQSLRLAADKFRRRFGEVEALALQRGIDIHAADLATLDGLWDEIKGSHRPPG